MKRIMILFALVVCLCIPSQVLAASAGSCAMAADDMYSALENDLGKFTNQVAIILGKDDIFAIFPDKNGKPKMIVLVYGEDDPTPGWYESKIITRGQKKLLIIISIISFATGKLDAPSFVTLKSLLIV